MQTPAFPFPIHLGFIIIVLPLVWVFVVVAEFLCFGSLFEEGLFVSGSFVWVFCCWFPHSVTQLFMLSLLWRHERQLSTRIFVIFVSKGFKMVRWPPSMFLKSTEYYMKVCHTGTSGITKCFHAVIPWMVYLYFCCFYVSFIMEAIYPFCEA